MPVRHVFVYRHCVRSTEAELKVMDADPSAYSSNPADYIAVPLPTWGTAPMWCTAQGAEILQGTGQYLMQHYFPSFGAMRKLRMEWITDVDQRDVDTSLNMAQGMAQALRQDSSLADTTVQGLLQLQYDPVLFDPIGTETWDVKQPLCQKATAASQNKFVSERFETIPKPNDGNIQDVIDLMQQHGGIGAVGPWSNITPTFLNTEKSELGGQINPIHYFAEAAFYSKASNISFLENMTQPELIQLLSWHYWKRSVESVGNNKIAMMGGLLMDRVLRSLAGIGHEKEDHDVDQTATFFIGHDSNLDELATVLGLRWILPPPYPSGKDGIWTPTPPNIGFHFAYDPDASDNSVHMSVLTPVYFNNVENGSDQLIMNKTGVPEECPVLFDGSLSKDSDLTIQTGTRYTSVTGNAGENILELLRKTLEERLETFPGAIDCYHKGRAAGPTPAPVAITTAAPTMANPIHTDVPTITHGMATKAPKPSSAKREVFSVWMAFIFMSAILICLVRSVRRQRHGGGVGGRRSATYTEMGDAHHDLSFEMT